MWVFYKTSPVPHLLLSNVKKLSTPLSNHFLHSEVPHYIHMTSFYSVSTFVAVCVGEGCGGETLLLAN